VRSVENLEQVVARQATELAPGAGSRHQFDAAVAGPTIGTGDIGLSHGREGNTLTMVVLPGRCAGREAAQRGLTLIYQITKPTTYCDRWCHSQVIHNLYTGCPQPP
jgi:hypothetical protein